MGFLWQLLPGAREARNQVIIGYAWLLGLALLFGVPSPPKGSHLDELASSLGAVGVGIGLSFAAFLIGSFSDDLASFWFRTRGALAFSRGSEESPILTIRKMEEWGLRAELERLESSIDRVNAEVVLRIGLVLPGILVASALLRTGAGWLGFGLALLATAGLAWQALRRRRDLSRDVARSTELRDGVAEEIARDPDLLERREALENAQARANEKAREKEAARRAVEEERQRAAKLAIDQQVAELDDLTGRGAELDDAARARLAELQEWKARHDERVAAVQRQRDEARAKESERSVEIQREVEKARAEQTERLERYQREMRGDTPPSQGARLVGGRRPTGLLGRLLRRG